MADLAEIVDYMDARLRLREIRDFKGADNGLQVGNRGSVKRIAAAVDAGLLPFEEAAKRGCDLLLVHHGLFWSPPLPVTGANLRKFRALLDNDIALYSAHLPLDCHPEIGNNALLARDLGVEVSRWAIEHEGTPMAAVCATNGSRESLRTRLEALFTQVTVLEFGSGNPGEVAILTGSGGSALPELRGAGVDTLITGELKQNHFNMAQELGLNVYACGHYATETYGVKALATEVAAKFGLEWEFIDTGCPL